MSTAQQIFLFFYAIVYGAFFTLSDRWKPFTLERGRPGFIRFCVSMTLLGLLPIAYFSYVFLVLGDHNVAYSRDFCNFLRLLAVFALVAPTYGFYCFWEGVILLNRRTFYSDTTWEQLRERVPTELLDEKLVTRDLVLGSCCIAVPLVVRWLVFP